MQINFRLAQILEEKGDTGRGVIKRICDHTKLERHQVAALLKNKVQYLNLKALGAVCDYLVHWHQVDRALLPGLLFALEPGEFWSMIGGRRFVEICFGVRRDKNATELIAANDSYLHGVILHELLGFGRDERLRRKPQFVEQRLVSAFGPGIEQTVAERQARMVYENFNKHGGDRAPLCVGSIKSNVVVDILMANAFGTQPFVSQDNVSEPAKRSCPVYFRFRDDDPHPPSCYGGMRLSRKKTSRPLEPGIHYETASGEWVACPWNATQDAAIVFYTFRPALGVLEMVMGGFSGRATRCLADLMVEQSNQLWPPGFVSDDLRVGAVVVQFDFEGVPKPPNERNPLEQTRPIATRVIPLDAEVLQRRFAP